MVRWSLMGEYLSLLIIGIIFIRYYCYEGSVVFSLKKKIFLGCLLSAAASIFLNILTVLTISNPGCIPLWLGILLNSGYFVVVGGACTLFALFMFLLTLEHVYDRHCMKMACTVLLVLFSLYLLAVVVNLFNGCLFYYDAAEQYQRGPLNRIVFLLPIMQKIAGDKVCFIDPAPAVSKRLLSVIEEEGIELSGNARPHIEIKSSGSDVTARRLLNEILLSLDLA